MSLGLITSAAYVNAEMAAEFGLLPPAFLPIGNARLYSLQAKALRGHVDRIALSLPRSFEAPDYDLRALEALGVEIIRIPDGLRLADSIMQALLKGLDGLEPVTILHGDTLIADLAPFPLDSFSVHRREHPYPWATLNEGATPRINPADLTERARRDSAIVSGLFRFSDPLGLLRALTDESGDFVAVLNEYDRRHPLAPVIDQSQWLDFGHLNTYYSSRREMTTERAFNSLSFEGDVVFKHSAQHDKMRAEANWFASLPTSMKLFTPQFLGERDGGPDGASGYCLEYEHLSPLSDLHVFGALPARSWRGIFRSCAEFLDLAKAAKPATFDPDWRGELYEAKSRARLAEFAAASGFEMDQPWRLNGVDTPSPLQIVNEMSALIPALTAAEVGVMHGDFCFSNLLFDFRRRRIKVLDPRGYVGGYRGVFGDTRYDLGKLYHSVGGRYDFIIGGFFDAQRDGPRSLRFELPDTPLHGEIEQAFADDLCGGDPARLQLAAAISVVLFLSMLPLHYDRPDRQLAFLGNAFRLYLRHFGNPGR